MKFFSLSGNRSLRKDVRIEDVFFSIGLDFSSQVVILTTLASRPQDKPYASDSIALLTIAASLTLWTIFLGLL